MIETSRRSLITGLAALVAAPAIVKVASLMPVNAALQPGNNLLTLNQITREAVRLFRDSNEFIRNMDAQFAEDRVFYEGEQWDKVWLETVDNQDARIGDTLRIRLPNDYVVSDGPSLSMQEPMERYLNVDWGKLAGQYDQPVVPVAVGPLALAAAAVTLAPAMLEKPVTRRFWSK